MAEMKPASPPTLARLSFWIPPERMPDFESAYEQRIAPLLGQHGPTESSERPRAAPDAVFSRLFEVKAPAEVAEIQDRLQGDPAWQQALRDLGADFGADPGGPIRHAFGIYAAPAGPGSTVPAGRGRGHWRTYDATDGLAGGDIWAIFQDREGHLWFGAPYGVSRYDGQTWTTFTAEDGLAGSRMMSIFRDREGHLWFGTLGGVSRYDPSAGSGQAAWTTFTTEEGLANNAVGSILQDREGCLWFGTETPWSEGGGVSRYDPSAGPGQAAWTTFTTREGLAGNSVRSIIQDVDGRLWFGTESGVSRYDPSAGLSRAESRGSGQAAWTTFTQEDGLVDNRVWSIIQDMDGRLWFGTESGVSRYDGRNWTSFTAQEGLTHNSVLSIAQDREGNLWFGTIGGLSRYDGEPLITFNTGDGLADNTEQPMLQDGDGHLWFGTMAGVSRYDGRTWTTFTTADGLADNMVWSICYDRDGRFWLGTGGGVSRYDGRTWTTFTTADGLPGGMVRSVFQDRDGHLWFSISGGLSRYDGKVFTPVAVPDMTPPAFVMPILQDRKGHLWFGTRGSGVRRYDPSAGSGQAAWTSFTTEDGLAGDNIFSIIQDREGNLWFGTVGGGVSRYDGQAFTTFTTKEGLADNTVWSMLQDREGNLWFGTLGGVSRYDGRVFQTMTHRDGLAGNWIRGIFQDQDGRLWFATANGVTRYLPPAPSPPPVFIDTVVADRRYDGVSELSIPSTVGITAFEFHGISFKTRPEAMVYRYRLKGHDGAWRNTHERRVEYQDLPIGEYTFEVLAVDRDLVYSEALAAVHLKVIRDPRDEQIDELERRVRERTRELRESNEALSNANRELVKLNLDLKTANEQVTEATRLKSQFLSTMSHELRTPMNAIIGFTRLILRRGADALPERQRDNLQKVKVSADQLLALINDILDLSKVEAGQMDVRASSFDVGRMIAGCCATVGPSLGKPGVELRSDVPDDIGEAHTDEARLRQIVINLLSNALKFTDRGEVSVRARKEEGRLAIAVSDTGIGIPPDAMGTIFEEFRQVDGTSTRKHQGTGLGLSIVKKLAELLGGTIEVESEQGKGSLFTLRVPVVYSEKRSAEAQAASSPGVSRLTSSGDEEGTGPAIVVIDDDPNVADLLRQELAEEGYRVVGAANADEGLARVKAVQPVAVTVDIVMPGKDGWETIAMLKADPETRHIPVIVLSVSDNRELGYRLGVQDYLVKPIDRESLLAALGRLDSGGVRDVLVVEDDAVTRTLLCEMLRLSGFQPRCAENGQDGLDQIAKRRPDAILLDLMMPVMDGFEVVDRLQADPELREIPVVVVTAKDLTSDELAFLHRRVSRVVEKGDLDPDALGGELREVLRRYEGKQGD